MVNLKAIEYLDQLMEEETSQEERNVWLDIYKNLRKNRFNLGERNG